MVSKGRGAEIGVVGVRGVRGGADRAGGGSLPGTCQGDGPVHTTPSPASRLTTSRGYN